MSQTVHAHRVCCVSVLWKQKLMQLNKRTDKEPTEMVLEDWGISLILCFTVPAYKAACVSAAPAPICPDVYFLAIHLQALRGRNTEKTSHCFASFSWLNYVLSHKFYTLYLNDVKCKRSRLLSGTQTETETKEDIFNHLFNSSFLGSVFALFCHHILI